MHLLAVFALLASYPTKAGTAGVSFTLPGGGVPTVGVTYFIANDLAARADFGLNAAFGSLIPGAPNPPAGFSLGAGLRFYQLKRDRVAVFLTPIITFGRGPSPASAAGAEYAEFLNFAGGVGVEYFFTDHFAAGAVLALALNLANIGGPTGTNTQASLSTSTSGLFANIYF